MTRVILRCTFTVTILVFTIHLLCLGPLFVVVDGKCDRPNSYSFATVFDLLNVQNAVETSELIIFSETNINVSTFGFGVDKFGSAFPNAFQFHLFNDKNNSWAAILETTVHNNSGELIVLFLHSTETKFYQSLEQIDFQVIQRQYAVHYALYKVDLQNCRCRPTEENLIVSSTPAPAYMNSASLISQVPFAVIQNSTFINQIYANDDMYVIGFLGDNNTTAAATTTIGLPSLWEMYSIQGIRFIQQVQLTSGCQINWRNFSNKVPRRKDFRNATIRAIAPFDPDYVSEVRFENTSTGGVIFQSGTSVDMLWFLRDALNFTEIAMAGDWIQEDNDTLYGTGLDIKMGRADIAIEQTTMSYGRRKHIYFLHPTYFNGLDAFFVQPPLSSARNLYMAPFKMDLWITMFASWIFLIITMKICAWLKSLLVETDQKDAEVMSNICLWAVGAICQQGWYIQPVSLSLRIIFLTGYFTGVVCFVAFSAAIVSLLSVKLVPIKNMDDLTANSFHFYANRNSTSLDGLQELLERQPNYPNGTIVEEEVAIEQLIKGRHALLTYPDIFYVELRNLYPDCSADYTCGTYYSVPVSQSPFRSAMMVNKKSPFVEYFNYMILLMRESGLNHRFITTYWTATQIICLTNSSGYKEALGILDVLTAIYILLAGYAMSFTVFCIEFMWGKSKIANTNPITLPNNL